MGPPRSGLVVGPVRAVARGRSAARGPGRGGARGFLGRAPTPAPRPSGTGRREGAELEAFRREEREVRRVRIAEIRVPAPRERHPPVVEETRVAGAGRGLEDLVALRHAGDPEGRALRLPVGPQEPSEEVRLPLRVSVAAPGEQETSVARARDGQAARIARRSVSTAEPGRGRVHPALRVPDARAAQSRRNPSPRREPGEAGSRPVRDERRPMLRPSRG